MDNNSIGVNVSTGSTLGSSVKIGTGIKVNVSIGGSGTCPLIDEIDGGDLINDDSQFTPMNGLLDGGSL